MANFIGLIILALTLTLGSANAGEALSDDEVRQLIISESISRYSGNCACPYNSTRNGSKCGGRSAYSRPGGQSPLCYRNDVTEDNVGRYRERHRIKSP